MVESILVNVAIVLFLLVFLFAIGLGIWMFFSMARDALRGRVGRQPLSPSSRRNLRLAIWLFGAMGLFLVGLSVSALIEAPHRWQGTLPQLASGIWALSVSWQAHRERTQS